jgi:glycosyltransferase involved in cell wall biosynthesis
VRVSEPGTWSELKAATIKGLYERTYRRRLDRVWVVSPSDATAMRWVTGVRNVDVLPNGVDTDLYGASDAEGAPETCVFWGRLDFGPNIQALDWFCRHVWPGLRARHPQATFTIIGFQPGEDVQRLARLPGVQLQADVPDIRPVVARHAVVVLPFVSGGGIKNKLLEAAAMAKAIVCTPRSLGGLNGQPPVRVARSPQDWQDAIESLWSDPRRRVQAGLDARAWVIAEHTWTAVARKALEGLRQLPSEGAGA